MKTEKEWEKAILNITMRIHQEFPELSKFINEVPLPTSSVMDNYINIQNLASYHNTLMELTEKYSETHNQNETDKSDEKGYPLYPDSEDIYVKDKKEMNLNPEDLSENKTDEMLIGNDLDVPGSELDDQQESIGSEDEENNYYSLGGDNHNDLDENNRT